MYNLLTTNVPGPQFPLYLLGREMMELMPVAFLAPDQRLAIACMSYNGTVALSLIGDYDGDARPRGPGRLRGRRRSPRCARPPSRGQ